MVLDITYVRTDQGWLYLAVVLDVGSRWLVGYAMSDRIDTRLAAALYMAAHTPGCVPKYSHKHYMKLMIVIENILWDIF